MTPSPCTVQIKYYYNLEHEDIFIYVAVVGGLFTTPWMVCTARVSCVFFIMLHTYRRAFVGCKQFHKKDTQLLLKELAGV